MLVILCSLSLEWQHYKEPNLISSQHKHVIFQLFYQSWGMFAMQLSSCHGFNAGHLCSHSLSAVIIFLFYKSRLQFNEHQKMVVKIHFITLGLIFSWSKGTLCQFFSFLINLNLTMIYDCTLLKVVLEMDVCVGYIKLCVVVLNCIKQH